MHGEVDSERTVYATHDAFEVRSDCVIQGHAKFIRLYDAESGKVVARRLFDLKQDLNETESVPCDLDKWQPLIRASAESREPRYDPILDDDLLPEETREQLEALGYFRGA
jgi:hypothetical protein